MLTASQAPAEVGRIGSAPLAQEGERGVSVPAQRPAARSRRWIPVDLWLAWNEASRELRNPSDQQ